MALGLRDQCVVLTECPTTASTKDKSIAVESSGVLLSLYVESLSGTLDINVYTFTKDGHEKLVDSFPTISAPTTELILRKQVEIHDHMRVEVITTGAAKYDIRAKGVEAGISSVTISGSGAADNYGILMDTTPRLIVPVSVTDQNNVSIINNNPAGGATLYVGFKSTITVGTTATPGTVDPNAASPVPPGGSIGLNVTAGLAVYGVASVGTVDVRVVLLGG